MAKKFDIIKMKRGKSLSEAAQNISSMDEETSQSIENLILEPRKGNVNNALVAINRDQTLSKSNKKILIDSLREQFADLFNFNNCPDDYETLKVELLFLSELTQVSFLLLGQRLMKIRDNELYRNDGYSDFKSFVTNEIKISRSTAYNYIDLVSVFGVQTFGHVDSPDPSKLIPLLSILKSGREEIPCEMIKSQFIEEARTKSARDIKEDAKQLKIKYGLLDTPEHTDPFDRAFNSLLNVFPSKLSALDKKKIRNYIKQLNSLLESK